MFIMSLINIVNVVFKIKVVFMNYISTYITFILCYDILKQLFLDRKKCGFFNFLIFIYLITIKRKVQDIVQ